MKAKLDILIVEDHLGFAEGLELLLNQYHKVKHTYIRNTFQGTLDFLKSNSVDIVVLDLNFETNEYDGFLIAKKIKQQYPLVRIIVLTQHARKEHYSRLFEECKVDAYLDKKLSITETFKAIDAVIKGNIYIDHSISDMLEIESWMTISEREKEVVRYLITGLTQKEIAAKMFVVPKTIEAHIRNLFEKFNVKNSVELVAKYVQYKNANRENIDDSIPPFKHLTKPE